MRDLFTVIPRSCITDDFCGKHYWDWEMKAAEPRLKALGYERITFRIGDSDSFGPLTRIVRCYKGGQCHEFMYG